MNDGDEPSRVRVLLVDDQELVRSGLTRILRPRDGFTVVGECEDGDQVVDAVRRLRPDVVVMDLRMRRTSGIEATAALRGVPDPPPVLVLTTFDDDELLSGALRAGAAGFLLKDSAAEDVVRGVRAVAAGQALLDPAVTGRVLERYRSAETGAPPGRPVEELTAREREVLELMGRGLSNGEIAATLLISEVTVKSHIGRIFTKLDLRDRAAAIVYAFDHGLVSPRGATPRPTP
ncbi:response regulator transcription factor [Nocardioides anomalus]|uniref:Response regulator transcription factor n=1 Tax=Nocardioides anomalus TaxID=2712223 RepID=A0A6G6WKT8_9ACTN|nr:response regulator transcription factor [Nocardioides anomalus]QIG45816.1 response regulator transcription factor [Nocardioides anomalus]